MIVLQRDSRLPVYRQLYNALREEIISGRRGAGERLPSKRAMASQLGVSVNTVDAAYSQLASEGYLSVRERSGFTVCRIDAVQSLCLSAPPVEPPQSSQPFAVDFSPSGMARQLFPLTAWQRAAKEVLASRQWLERCPRKGDLRLREAIAQYLQKARDVRCAPEQVIIGSGTESLISMLGLMLDSSVAFAVEDPVYNRSDRVLSRMGHPVITAEVDRQGVMPEPLEALDHVVLYTTPSHQYPLGICMPMARRAKLLNWCSGGTFRYIIEDDYDSEFRYDARPVPSLQSIDKNDRIIYLGTFSETVASSLRIGYMVLPQSLLPLYAKNKGLFSCNVPVPEQMILREFMEQGHFERHLNRMRTYYKRNRNDLIEQLGVFGKDIQVIGEAAGHHLTIKVCQARSEAELCSLAAAEGVRVYPISDYFIGKMPQKYRGKLLLGFGSLTQEQIADGVARLYRAWGRNGA